MRGGSRLGRWFALTCVAAVLGVTPLAPADLVPAAGAAEADHVQALGGAGHHGSLDSLAAAGVTVADAAIAAAVPTPTGAGYWLTMTEGSIYSFGDARFFGSFGSLRAAGVIVGDAPIVAMAATPSGGGYWLADDRGGVFTFGDARFFGSGSGAHTEPAVDFAAVGAAGYRILWADGRVNAFGDAPDHGSATVAPTQAALALATSSGGGYWVVTPQIRADATAPPLPPGSGAGRRIVYSNSRQRVWLVETTGVVSASWPVSGRQGVPPPGSYRVFSKSRSSVDRSGSLVLPHMVRFAHGRSLAIGFHAIPTNNGRPIQSEAELGQYRSAGCVRQAPGDAAHLYAWAPVGTPVVVTP